jgi:hypothetical protein
MAYFRLYLLNPQTGRIENFEEFEAGSDAEAIERADRHSHQAAVELWCGARKIHRREPLHFAGGSAAAVRPPRTPLSA